VAPQHREPIGGRRLGHLLGEAGLADARLTGHEHEPAPAGSSFAQQTGGAGQLALPSDKRQAGHQARCGIRFVAHREGADGLGHALELERAERVETETGPARKQAGHQLRAQDLAGIGLVAQPAGHHHRRAEEVGFVPEGLPGVEAHPDGQTLTRHRPARRLLHGDGASQGVSSGGERPHQPVAQPFHFGAPVGGGRLGQQRVVGAEDALGVLVSGPGQQLGRAHEVGEQDGDESRGALSHCGAILSDSQLFEQGSRPDAVGRPVPIR
jgi:hypothetical protein